MSVANIRETKIGISYRYQSDIHTLPGPGNYWSLTKTNPALAGITLATETDEADIGKGHEFAENVYLTNWDAQIPYEKFCSSEVAAFAFAYSLGTVTATTPAAGAHQYVCTPLDPVVDGIELKQFTYAESIRQGAGALFDRASVGCVLQSWSMSLKSGPGRANCVLNMDMVGCGKILQPSTVTIPPATKEHFLNAGSAQIDIIGQNYITLKRIVSLDITWNNAIRLDQGFYPGSGTYGGTTGGAAIRGRMENGDRTATLVFVVRMESTSTELDSLLNQTEGTAVISLKGDLIAGTTYNGLSITFHRVRIKAAVIADDAGLVTIQCECAVLYDSSLGVITATATTQTGGIHSAAA